jgi:hypothetical protein
VRQFEDVVSTSSSLGGRSGLRRRHAGPSFKPHSPRDEQEGFCEVSSSFAGVCVVARMWRLFAVVNGTLQAVDCGTSVEGRRASHSSNTCFLTCRRLWMSQLSRWPKSIATFAKFPQSMVDCSVTTSMTSYSHRAFITLFQEPIHHTHLRISQSCNSRWSLEDFGL